MRQIFTLLLLLCTPILWAQQSKQVYFIGNSYTGTYNIPNLISQIATSAGDILTYTAHNPGGSTLQQHANNPTVINQITTKPWDYVVLQEQSQLPSFPPNQVDNQVVPYAAQLSNLVKDSNPCAQVVFYMTWGRKYGDPQNCANGWTPVCTYEGMDDQIRQTYTQLATANDAILSPVGVVWRYLINNYPGFDLYSNDESHPSMFGAMASAYTFYTVFYQKSPHEASFSSSLNPAQLAAIKEAVETVVYNDMNTWDILQGVPTASFDFNQDQAVVNFTHTSQNIDTVMWDFGDGTTSTEENPTYIYTEPGTYRVTLKVQKCNLTHTTEQVITISTLSNHSATTGVFNLYPNPTSSVLNIQAYQPIQSITIMDIQGRLIKPIFEHGVLNMSLDVQDLSNGMYYIQIETLSGKQQMPFVKK